MAVALFERIVEEKFFTDKGGVILKITIEPSQPARDYVTLMTLSFCVRNFIVPFSMNVLMGDIARAITLKKIMTKMYSVV